MIPIMEKIVFVAMITQLLCCSSPINERHNYEGLKEEVRQVERAFNNMAASKGIKAAFLHFAAETAVLNRGPGLIEGKEAIGTYFDNQVLQKPTLTWKPDFVDVSQSGEMAYTYGPYVFTARDTTGNEIKAEGYFHAVWKKQPSGEWKFVYD
jgi:ketosteroid isomerase-like protein